MKKILALLFVVCSFFTFAQSDMELAKQTVDQNLIKSHIGFLASDELKGRDTPSEGLKIAAKYIESRFVEYGVKMAPGMDSYFQSVPMKKVSPPTSGTLTLVESKYNLADDFILMDGDNIELSA